MINKKTQKYKRIILLFLTIVSIYCVADNMKRSFLLYREKKAYDAVNNALTLKMKAEISYRQFCSSNGLYDIEKNWPFNANSFFFVLEDHSFGSYEGKVFFNTGEVFGILTTKGEASQDKLDSFEKLKWPDIKQGDVYWGIKVE